MSNIVAFNPNDPAQQQFLGALALGETGNSPNAATLGTGGVDLSGATTDASGFPLWQGTGNSHAAGIFQFQPGTWAPLASTYGLNFSNPADQEAGAWILAQQTYANATGGNLEADLQTPSKFTQIQNALRSVWPSVTGNQAAPQGLANDLASGTGANLPGVTGSAASGSSNAAGGASGGGIVNTVENFFVRFGLVIIGGIIVIVALWQLLSSQGIVPSPADTGKAVTKGALALA